MNTPPDTPYDLVIHAGRVICPATGLDGAGAVALRGDRIAAVLDSEESAALTQDSARQTLSFPDGILLPGLVDAHAHPALSGSKYGIDPDAHILPFGSTTVLSQGDAGARNWARYKEETIAGSRTRIYMALNLSASGESNEEGCFADLSDADVDACVATVMQDPAAIWGIAVNVGPNNCRENDPREVMARALAAAERTGKPLAHRPAPPRRLVAGRAIRLAAPRRRGDLLLPRAGREPGGRRTRAELRVERPRARRPLRFRPRHGLF